MSNNSTFIVITGKSGAKLTYIGPFADYENAEEFASENRPHIKGAPMWVAEVVAPGLWWEDSDCQHKWNEDEDGIEVCALCGEERGENR